MQKLMGSIKFSKDCKWALVFRPARSFHSLWRRRLQYNTLWILISKSTFNVLSISFINVSITQSSTRLQQCDLWLLNCCRSCIVTPLQFHGYRNQFSSWEFWNNEISSVSFNSILIPEWSNKFTIMKTTGNQPSSVFTLLHWKCI